MSTSKEQEIEELPAEELPAEEAEAEAKPKSKGKGKGKPAKDDGKDDADAEPKAKRAKSGKEVKAAEEKEARAEARTKREADPNERKIPYPPTPADVPEDLTEFPESFKQQQNFLLAGLFVFLTFYIGTLLLSALVGVWCVWSFWHWFPLKVVGLFFSSLVFLFLVKGFFKRRAMERDMNVELTEDEYPTLFEFIHRLCDEVGAPLPNKVFVSPDVNAMCISNTSLLSLFIEPKKDVLIGLGLVNAVNLSEFKAILAHEFGHFSHLGNTSNYVHIVKNVIVDMVRGEDWLDRLVAWCKKKESLKAVGYAIGGPLWLGRMMLVQVFKLIARQDMAVSREQEFHADLVAVSAAGSDAATHGLLRARFGMYCFIQAINDLAIAIDHKLYSNDLYLHQDRAAVVVRRKEKEPDMGLPPALPHPTAGQTLRVFDAEQEEIEDRDQTPPMWRSHPSDADREENAKERFVAAAIDHRSPWLVFDNAADLRERMTYKFYRMVFKIPKNTDLSDAVKVQKFIDNEHADTTYDAKYKGCYDDRPLEPGDLAELNAVVRDKPWDDDRMEKVLTKLYDGCESHAEAHSELYKELQSLRGSVVGRPSPKLKRQIEEKEKEQDANWEWFKSFDRRVYLLHVQMANQVDKELKEELIERYRFQLEVQRLYQESRNAFNKADAYLSAHAAAVRGEINVGPEFIGEVLRVLRESWKALKGIIKDAREINLPAMKNFEEGESLVDFILEGKMVPEPPLNYAKGAWINKLMTQLQGVRQKCFRLHFKSVGGILRLQEQIAGKWKAAREPIGAEVVEVEAIEAEVIEAEVIPAEVIEAEVIPVEVIEAEEIPAEVVAEVAPAVPPLAAQPEPPKAMAAFVGSSPPPAPAHELHSPPPSSAPVALDLSPPAEPAPRVNVFDFDAPTAAPAVPPPAAFPAPESIAEAAAAAPEPVAEAGTPVAPADFFSLDADAPKPVAPAPMPAAQAAPPVDPANQTLWLDPAKLKAEKEAREAAKAAEPPSLSGLAEMPTPRAAVPAPKPAAPKPVAKADTKPANGKRPALRITMVKPGEKSPLAK